MNTHCDNNCDPGNKLEDVTLDDGYVCEKCEDDIKVCTGCRAIVEPCRCGFCYKGAIFHESE